MPVEACAGAAPRSSAPGAALAAPLKASMTPGGASLSTEELTRRSLEQLRECQGGDSGAGSAGPTNMDPGGVLSPQNPAQHWGRGGVRAPKTKDYAPKKH